MFVKLFISAVILQVSLSDPVAKPNPQTNPLALSRIIGGISVESEKNIPYQAAVFLANYLCGGTILKENVIITAAHCTDAPIEVRANANVRVGSLYYNQGGQLIPVDKIYDHPNYNSLTEDSDVSLLKLSYNLQLSDTVKIIGLASYPRKTGSIVTVSGWGRTVANDTNSVALLLQSLSIPFIDSETCRSQTSYGNRITNNMTCAGHMDLFGYDSCQGDSGGPLVHDNELIGIVSWGDSCAIAGLPGVYTNVFAFIDWILNTISKIQDGY